MSKVSVWHTKKQPVKPDNTKGKPASSHDKATNKKGPVKPL